VRAKGGSVSDLEFVSLDQMLATGLTRRQVDYWATRGYLRPVKTSPGSGASRRWPAVERDVARLMARLTQAGLAPDVAAPAARAAVVHDLDEVTIADGITIAVREVA
jgi:hypothetical protein